MNYLIIVPTTECVPVSPEKDQKHLQDKLLLKSNKLVIPEEIGIPAQLMDRDSLGESAQRSPNKEESTQKENILVNNLVSSFNRISSDSNFKKACLSKYLETNLSDDILMTIAVKDINESNILDLEFNLVQNSVKQQTINTFENPQS